MTGNPGALLNDLCTDYLTPRNLSWAGSLGGTINIQEETESFGFMASAGKTVIIVSVLSPPPMQLVGRQNMFCVESFLHMAKFEYPLAL